MITLLPCPPPLLHIPSREPCSSLIITFLFFHPPHLRPSSLPLNPSCLQLHLQKLKLQLDFPSTLLMTNPCLSCPEMSQPSEWWRIILMNYGTKMSAHSPLCLSSFLTFHRCFNAQASISFPILCKVVLAILFRYFSFDNSFPVVKDK